MIAWQAMIAKFKILKKMMRWSRPHGSPMHWGIMCPHSLNGPIMCHKEYLSIYHKFMHIVLMSSHIICKLTVVDYSCLCLNSSPDLKSTVNLNSVWGKYVQNITSKFASTLTWTMCMALKLRIYLIVHVF